MRLRPTEPPAPPRENTTSLGMKPAACPLLAPITAYQQLPLAFQQIIQRTWARPSRTALAAGPAANKAGIGVSTLWRDLKLGLFVPPIKLSPRRTAFLDVEIDALLEAKALLSRSSLTVDLRVFIVALAAQPDDNRLSSQS